jgi:hypothetical protein
MTTGTVRLTELSHGAGLRPAGARGVAARGARRDPPSAPTGASGVAPAYQSDIRRQRARRSPTEYVLPPGRVRSDGSPRLPHGVTLRVAARSEVVRTRHAERRVATVRTGSPAALPLCG